MGKISAFLHLIRPVNCAMMGLAVIVGVSLVNKEFFTSTTMAIPLCMGFTVAFTLTAVAMTVNDYYDREIDAINEPQRPIPSGAVTTNEALFLASILTVIGLGTALFTNLVCFITAIIAWIILVVYSTRGKSTGLLGNLLVSTCSAIPFIYASFLAVGSLQPNVILFAAMAFLSNTGREVTKGIVDVAGDRSRNIKTVAVTHGEKAAAATASVFYISAVALSPFPWLFKLVSDLFLPLVIITDAGLVLSSISLLHNSSRENARKIKNIVLLWFLTGLLAFIMGSF